MDDRQAPRRDPPGPARYGGEHHRLSLIDWIGSRVEVGIESAMPERDPELIRRLMPVVEACLSYFAAEVRDFERVPDEPVLIVGNHSGGIYMPDFYAFLREWARRRGVDAPLYSLGFDLLFAIPGFGTLARRLGAVPANQTNADRLLADGASVLIYPGGDREDFRPWVDRGRVDFQGHMGFVRLALRQGVPVVPVVSHGSHEVIVVLTSGERLAHRLGIDRLNINILPLVATVPWGIVPVAPLAPLPSKVTVQVCEPLDWRGHGAGAADDPEVVRQCYDEIVGRMQAGLDELRAEVPHPVLARLRNPLNRGRR